MLSCGAAQTSPEGQKHHEGGAEQRLGRTVGFPDLASEGQGAQIFKSALNSYYQF